jgi:hypothetical protein
MQIVELHYHQSPTCNYSAVKARAQEILGSDLDSPDPREADKAFLIFHKQRPVEYLDGQVPAQTAIFAADQPPQIETYRQDIQQSWRCQGAEELLRGSSACMICNATFITWTLMS